MRQRGTRLCEICADRMFEDGRYCYRCKIHLEISRDMTRTAIRSKKSVREKAASSASSVVEVLSSDEERRQTLKRKMEEAEVISDDESSDEDVPEDWKENDPRTAANDGLGVFEHEMDANHALLSRKFTRCRFRPRDFPVSIALAGEPEENEAQAHAAGKKRPSSSPSKKSSKKKKPLSLASMYSTPLDDLTFEELHFIHNQDDYAPSDYEMAPPDLTNVSDAASEASEGDEDFDREERIRVRASRAPVPDEKCYFCSSKTAPGDSKLSRVQCPDCKGVYHRSCAISYGGEGICWPCAEDDLIDDSELTQEDIQTTNELFGVFHIKKEQVEEQSNEEKEDDENEETNVVEEEKEGELVVPDASQVKQTILECWKTFFDSKTVQYDDDFIAATRAIEEANGFKTTLESDLHKLFQHFTNEQVKAEEMERKKAEGGNAIQAVQDAHVEDIVHDESRQATTEDNVDDVVDDEDEEIEAETTEPSSMTNLAVMEIDLTNDADDDDDGDEDEDEDDDSEDEDEDEDDDDDVVVVESPPQRKTELVPQTVKSTNITPSDDAAVSRPKKRITPSLIQPTPDVANDASSTETHVVHSDVKSSEKSTEAGADEPNTEQKTTTKKRIVPELIVHIDDDSTSNDDDIEMTEGTERTEDAATETESNDASADFGIYQSETTQERDAAEEAVEELTVNHINGQPSNEDNIGDAVIASSEVGTTNTVKSVEMVEIEDEESNDSSVGNANPNEDQVDLSSTEVTHASNAEEKIEISSEKKVEASIDVEMDDTKDDLKMSATIEANSAGLEHNETSSSTDHATISVEEESKDAATEVEESPSGQTDSTAASVDDDTPRLVTDEENSIDQQESKEKKEEMAPIVVDVKVTSKEPMVSEKETIGPAKNGHSSSLPSPARKKRSNKDEASSTTPTRRSPRIMKANKTAGSKSTKSRIAPLALPTKAETGASQTPKTRPRDPRRQLNSQ